MHNFKRKTGWKTYRSSNTFLLTDSLYPNHVKSQTITKTAKIPNFTMVREFSVFWQMRQLLPWLEAARLKGYWIITPVKNWWNFRSCDTCFLLWKYNGDFELKRTTSSWGMFLFKYRLVPDHKRGTAVAGLGPGWEGTSNFYHGLSKPSLFSSPVLQCAVNHRKHIH